VSGADTLAGKKALVIARADLARVEMSLAWHDLRDAVAPPPADARSTTVRRMATLLIAVAAPIVGRSKFVRVLRFASIALAALRAVRSLRGARR
jgi:hypothetical protein